MPRFPKAALAAAIICATLVGGPSVAQEEVSADTVVARVNGKEITVGHMIVLRARLPQQYADVPPQTLFDAILEQLVQQALLGEQVTDLSKVSRVILENEERALRATEAVNAIATEKVTDEAIQAAYDEAYGNAEPEPEFNASHILVETEDEAKAIVEELNGGADFATVAKEKSIGPSGPNGGSLGWFGKGMMVPPFEEAVMALDVGEVSAPVQTDFGWHVIILNEKREKAPPPLDTVRDEIVSKLEADAVQAVIAELTESADVERVEPGVIDPSVITNGALLEE